METKTKQQPSYSIVVPTYNEAKKEKEMQEHFQSIQDYFEKIGETFEVVIALDGPTDETPELAKKYTEDFDNFRIIDRKENKGKGYTVREGLLAAEGKIRLFTDTDGATPIKMLDKMIPKLKQGADIVIGSRDLSESEVKKHQPKWKEWAGDFGNLLIQVGIGLYGVKDTQCGFKAFTEESVRDIIPRCTVDRWGLDFEILAIGKRLDYQIEEVPVEWLDRGESLVGISGYLSTFKDLWHVRWNLIKGTYKLKNKTKEKK